MMFNNVINSMSLMSVKTANSTAVITCLPIVDYLSTNRWLPVHQSLITYQSLITNRWIPIYQSVITYQSLITNRWIPTYQSFLIMPNIHCTNGTDE